MGLDSAAYHFPHGACTQELKERAREAAVWVGEGSGFTPQSILSFFAPFDSSGVQLIYCARLCVGGWKSELQQERKIGGGGCHWRR